MKTQKLLRHFQFSTFNFQFRKQLPSFTIHHSPFTIGIFFFIFHFSFSQGVWSPRASLPDSSRGYGVGFSIGKYGYMGLGGRLINQWQYFNDFWQFDPSNNSWKRKANFPG